MNEWDYIFPLDKIFVLICSKDLNNGGKISKQIRLPSTLEYVVCESSSHNDTIQSKSIEFVKFIMK